MTSHIQWARKVLAKATEGPWIVDPDSFAVRSANGAYTAQAGSGLSGSPKVTPDDRASAVVANQRAIALSRNTVEALLDVLEAVKEFHTPHCMKGGVKCPVCEPAAAAFDALDAERARQEGA